MNKKLWRWGMLGMAALLATACLPKGFRLPQSPLLPVLERKSGLIAYLGTDFNIYTVDQGGGDPTPVTTDADAEGDLLQIYDFPAWAPDSQSLAFVGYSARGDGSAPPSIGLFVAQKDGQNLTQAYSSSTNVIYFYWSPDSQHLSLLAAAPNSNMALKLVSPSGGEAQTLDIGAPFYWTWAPDSRSVLVHVQ